jgi:hypothetical protein
MSERAPSDRTAMKLRKAAVTLRLSFTVIFLFILGISPSLIVYNKGGSQSAYLSAPLGHSPETLPSVSQIFERLLKGPNASIPLLQFIRLLTLNTSLHHLTLVVFRAWLLPSQT